MVTGFDNLCDFDNRHFLPNKGFARYAVWCEIGY